MTIKWATLGQVCEFIKDGTHASPERVPTGVPVLSATNVIDGELNFETGRYTNEAEYLSYKKRLEHKVGDVLLTIVGTIGRTAILHDDRPCVFQRSVAVLRCNQDVVHNLYLRRVLESDNVKKQLAAGTNKSAQAGIYLDKLKAISIPLPPLETQKHIARVLEQSDQLRKQAQQMESELNQLAQSLFLEMFGDYRKQPNDRFVPLSDVADVVSGVAKGSDLKGKQSRIVPYLRVANVQDGYLDLSEIKEIEATERDIVKYVLQPGDILMTEGGDYDKLGRGAMWSGEIEECIHQNHIFRVRLSERYEAKFFEYYLRSTMVKTYFLRCAKKTTNLASINMSQLKALLTPKEEKKKQERFVSALGVIEKQIQMARTKGEHLEQTFQALMQHAFNGKLTAPGSKAA